MRYLYLVSACLAGVNCRYNGQNALNEKIEELVLQGKAIPICPEVIGGLIIPRSCCEIIKDGDGKEKIISKDGEDFTEEFSAGAQKTLEIAKTLGAKKAILQSRSPSCGKGMIYDGTFSGVLIEGNGFTADLLIRNGIEVYTEKDFDNEKDAS